MRGKRRQTGHRRGEARTAAEEVIGPLVRCLLEGGLAPESVRDVFEEALQAHAAIATATSPDAYRQDLADLAHVLSVWHTEPRFVDRDGAPRPLRQHGRSPSFESLVRLANPAVSAPEALKKLLIAGAVEIDSKERVEARQRELLTRGWDELGLWNWRHAVRRLLETFEFNYTMPGNGRFQRLAHSERLPARMVPVFDRWVREHGAEFLRTADDWLTQQERKGKNGEDEDTVTAGVGMYLFVDEPDTRKR